MENITDYEKQAEDFLKATDTKIKVVFVENGVHFNDDQYRDIFKATLKRGKKSFSFKLGKV